MLYNFNFKTVNYLVDVADVDGGEDNVRQGRRRGVDARHCSNVQSIKNLIHSVNNKHNSIMNRNDNGELCPIK